MRFSDPSSPFASFRDYAKAITIANDTIYGLGSGVWSRHADLTYEASEDIKAGRVWVNTYNQYPAGAGFGGYKQSGYGRETDQQTLNNYQEVKNVLANHDPNPSASSPDQRRNRRPSLDASLPPTGPVGTACTFALGAAGQLL